MIWVRVGLNERAIRVKNRSKALQRIRAMHLDGKYDGKDLYILEAEKRSDLFNGKWTAQKIERLA